MLPFQVTASGAGARTPFLFDLMHLDGADLLGASAAERRAALEVVAAPGLLVPRIEVTASGLPTRRSCALAKPSSTTAPPPPSARSAGGPPAFQS